MKRDNRIISGLQCLCLTLVVVIQYTISYVAAPKLIERDYDTNLLIHEYTSDSFMFMTVMLSVIIIILEFCKEINEE